MPDLEYPECRRVIVKQDWSWYSVGTPMINPVYLQTWMYASCSSALQFLPKCATCCIRRPEKAAVPNAICAALSGSP